MSTAPRPYYFLDASIYIFRAYFSLPENWHSAEGYPLNAVYGYAAFLLDFLRKIKLNEGPLLAAAFDESLGSCYRNEIFPAYKSSREHADEALKFQLEACRKLTEILKIPCFSGPRFEADDYIASLARLAREQGSPVIVVSRDKDLGQLLLGESDSQWDFAADNHIQRQDVIDKFGVAPEQFTDYQGLVGDAVDDIPGVPGVGAKTAASLLQSFGSLEQLAYNLDRLPETGIRGAARIAKQLREHWPDALVSRQLATLADSIEGLSLPAELKLESSSLLALRDYLQELGIEGPILQRCQYFAGQL
jgi:5'-3' exonuclease